MKKALLIGINYINDNKIRLAGCINDIIMLKNLLIDAYDYKSSNITTLRDDKNYNSIPTRINIINEINNLMRESETLSEIWIHYSGHGSYIHDLNNDEIDGKDEVIIPVDYKTNGIIIDDELRNILQNAKCSVIITMDSCNSGTSWDITYSFPIIKNKIKRTIENKNKLKNQNIYMIAGSRDNESAVEFFNHENNLKMGALTSTLINCLRNRQHKVDILRLYLDIHIMFKKLGLNQNCLLSSSSPNPTYIIERNITNRQTNRQTTSFKNNTIVNNSSMLVRFNDILQTTTT